MAYNKFKKTVWETIVEKDIEDKLLLGKSCLRTYEGKVKGAGDEVKIIGAGKVTVTETEDGKPLVLGNPETLTETEIKMAIKRQALFNFEVADIDKAQGAGGALSIYTKDAAYGIASMIDKQVGKIALDPLVHLYSPTTTKITKTNVLDTIDDAVLWLQENSVDTSATKVTAYVSPRFYKFLRQNLISLDTKNSEMIKRGATAMYSNIDIVVSNNIYNDGTDDYCIIKTQKAVALVKALTHTEPYRPDSGFTDAVKGFTLYDTKLVRPKEIIVVKTSY